MTQLAQNKAADSFLIEFFHAFFRSIVHFRTPAFRSPFARARAASAPSSFMRFSVSNRQTPGLLEMSLTCRKQRKGVVSNRQSNAFSRRHFVPPNTERLSMILPVAPAPDASAGRFTRPRVDGVNEHSSMVLPFARFIRARFSREEWHLLEFSLSRAKSVASRFLIDNFRALFQTLPRRLARRP